MDLFKAAERFVQNERYVVEEKVDKSNEKVDVEPEINLVLEGYIFFFHQDLLALLSETLSVNGIGPDAFDYLEDLVADIEFVKELSMSSRIFHLCFCQFALHLNIERSFAPTNIELH